MTWAIHNWHTPAVEIDEAGTFTLDGKTRLPTGAPLFTAETREEAEAWRVGRLAGEVGGFTPGRG